MDDVLSTLQRLIATEAPETDDYDLTAFDFLTPAANGLHDSSKFWPLCDADLDALFASEPAHVNGTDMPDLASFLSPEAVTQATDLLKSSQSDDEISGVLLEVLGYDHIEDVEKLLSQRSSFQQSSKPNGVHINSEDSRSHAPRPQQPYVPQAQIVFRDAEAEAASRKAQQEGRKAGRQHDHPDEPIRDLAELERRRRAALDAAGNRDARAGLAVSTAHLDNLSHLLLKAEAADAVKYPHVYASTSSTHLLSALGGRFALPEGTIRTMNEHYEEITIPTPAKVPMRTEERLIPIDELDPLAKGSFPGYKTLNRLQSIVFPIAYKSNENMLVCAPTGAGKTDVAMLTVLRVLSIYGNIKPSPGQLRVTNANFKVVYVAPMKALAAEVVRKLSKRLAWLGVQVRELTGDMQLTRREIDQTHIIVTTPEKWAVVTNKPGLSGSLAAKVKLLIVDEVHLLHDERGAVIELLVARTLRQVESTQSLIRIVGLSATLPNYLDVADFLGVNRKAGLFYFDSAFRPVPLEQHFIGCKGKAGSPQSRANLNEACFDKVVALVQEGHQVMVFVHARKETVKTAMMLKERAQLDGLLDIFDPSMHPRYESLKKETGSSRNREMKELFQNGFGIHHAGMLRSDRTLSEKTFEQGVSKVLVCTATLAWGVNLPAYAVLIKGTQIYDPSKGAFIDLSILDVLQIFGRAGRPQYETHGVGYIATTADKVDHYVNAITQQHPIESKFVAGLVDALNSEIALGTISSLDEGVRWIGYTFLFVRMRRNPMVYGLTVQDVENDPSLGQERHKLMVHTAVTLSRYEMVSFDQDTASLSSTELGTIAAKFFLRAQTIEIFNELFKPKMTEADVLATLSKSKEFEQIAVRDEENTELEALLKKIPCQVQGGSSTSYGKVSILLQAYISKLALEDFALISDQGYVVQNAGRICRALFEIALSRKWSDTARVALSLCKAIERQMWPYDHPLLQSSLSGDMRYAITNYAEDVSTAELYGLKPQALADLLHTNEKNAIAVQEAARAIPNFDITAKVQTLTKTLLRVNIVAKRAFVHSSKHSASLFLWIWVADAEDVNILQLEQVSFHSTQDEISLTFDIADINLPNFVLHLESDTWFLNDHTLQVPIASKKPSKSSPFTPLLQIPLLSSKSILAKAGCPAHASTSDVLDTIQSQTCHSVLFSRSNVLICASSDESRMQIALQALLASLPSKIRVLVIAPDAKTARSLSKGFSRAGGTSLVFVTQPKDVATSTASVVVTSPAQLWEHLKTTSRTDKAAFGLVLCLDLHLLDPAYELSLEKLVSSVQRVVGLSFPLQDAASMAAWLGCPETHVYNFDPVNRPIPLQISIKAVASSSSLLSTALVSAYSLIKANASKTILCVLPSRFQLSEVASFFVRQLQSSEELGSIGPFVGNATFLENVAYTQSHNAEIKRFLESGITVLSENMGSTDRRALLQCVESKASRLLITTRNMLGHLASIQANVVILLGCTNVLADRQGARITTSYSTTDLLFLLSHTTEQFVAYCTERERDSYTRMLGQGQILESSLLQEPTLLLEQLLKMANRAETSQGQLLKLFDNTYLARRIERNPCFYLPSSRNPSYDLSRFLDECLNRLKRACLLKQRGSNFTLTKIGQAVTDGKLSLQRVLDLQKTGIVTDQSKLAVPEDALWQFYSRFPRALKDKIDAEKEHVASKAKLILWEGFKDGRLSALEELEEALLTLIIKSQASSQIV